MIEDEEDLWSWAERRRAARQFLGEQRGSFDSYVDYVRAERWAEVHKAMAEDNPDLTRLAREALAMEGLSETAQIDPWDQEGYILRSSARVPIYFSGAEGRRVAGQACILLQLSLIAPIEPQLFVLREEIKSLERTAAQFKD